LPADNDVGMMAESAEHSVDPRIDLAALRTQLAWDRTLLAWIRTTITLMGAGVAFDKGTQLLHQAKVLAGIAVVRNAHLLGLALTGVGTLLFAIVCWQYVLSLRSLPRTEQARSPLLQPALLISMLVILLGCAVFIVLLIDKS
jgi:putative membrane protein